jgi:ribosomal protein S18 acetylase RimI-like enzyme
MIYKQTVESRKTMFIFEKIKPETLPFVVEIVNSNSDYNSLENGNLKRTVSEVESEFLNPETESYLIKNKEVPIGVLDYLHQNPKDGFPWIGLLMVHAKFQSQGIGSRIYYEFEKKFLESKYNHVRLGVLQDNRKAISFWTGMGFEYVETKGWKEKQIDVFEKQLVE